MRVLVEARTARADELVDVGVVARGAQELPAIDHVHVRALANPDGSRMMPMRVNRCGRSLRTWSISAGAEVATAFVRPSLKPIRFLLNLLVVEAAGIEPASANDSDPVLHA